ncbi:MAG: transposase [Planctomycetota bacterium]|jgi:putative transposase
MPRSARIAPGGVVFHVLNRAIGRTTVFETDRDYDAFERVMAETLEHYPMRICSYCIMPNHWHFVLWPRRDHELAAFMGRLTTTHVRRWQGHRDLVGSGHLYQGRYRSFPVETDRHYLTVARYVERNALRAGLVERAEEWRWSSLWRRRRGTPEQRSVLCEPPVPLPRDWPGFVNRPIGEGELAELRASVERGRPYGDAAWQRRTAGRLGIESTLRRTGRPRKKP